MKRYIRFQIFLQWSCMRLKFLPSLGSYSSKSWVEHYRPRQTRLPHLSDLYCFLPTVKRSSSFARSLLLLFLSFFSANFQCFGLCCILVLLIFVVAISPKILAEEYPEENWSLLGTLMTETFAAISVLTANCLWKSPSRCLVRKYNFSKFLAQQGQIKRLWCSLWILCQWRMYLRRVGCM